jgi:hypothetical protein
MPASSLVVALHGSSPALLRARLRSAAAPLHAALAGANAVHLARAQMPPAVFGGDLLDLLGRDLAAVLTGNRQAEPERPHTPAEWLRTDGVPGDRSGAAPDARRPLPATLRRPAPFVPPTASGAATAGRLKDQSFTRVRTNRVLPTTNDWGAAAVDDILRTSGSSAPMPPSVAGAAPALPALTRQLREYGARTRRDRSAGTVAAAASAASPSAGESPAATLRQAREEQHTVAALESLQRLTRAAATEPGAAESRSWPTHHEPPIAEAFRSLRDHDDGSGGSQWDLSKRVADLLRAQARQHGIDLT